MILILCKHSEIRNYLLRDNIWAKTPSVDRKAFSCNCVDPREDSLWISISRDGGLLLDLILFFFLGDDIIRAVTIVEDK